MPLLGPNIPALVQKRDIAALLKILQRDDVHVRREAIRALGDLGDRAAVPALAALLTDDRHLVSEDMDAAQALGKIGDPTAIDALIQANTASLAREQAAIEEATAPADRPYRAGFYINRISADEYTLRSEIAQALGKIGSGRAIEALFQMLAVESGWMESTVRDAITQVIARTLKSDDASHARILIEHLTHASQEVRKWAAYYLRQFRSDEMVKALMNVGWNEKEEFAVREAALGTLGKIAGENILPELDELARGANRAVARLAAQTAMEIRARRQSPNEQS